MLGLAGVTAIETSVAEVTVRVRCGADAARAAVIVVEPDSQRGRKTVRSGGIADRARRWYWRNPTSPSW